MAQSQSRYAHLKVSRAIESGLLIRPDTCQLCDKKPDAHLTGKGDKLKYTSGIKAHHWKGYDGENALDVLFVCMSCNKILASPEYHTGSYTIEQLREIIRNHVYYSQKFTHKNMAAICRKTEGLFIALQSILNADSLDEAKAIARQALTHPTD